MCYYGRVRNCGNAVFPPSSSFRGPHRYHGGGFVIPTPLHTPAPTMTRPDRDGPARAQFEANKKIILATQDLCGICGKPVDKTLPASHPLSASIDHIIPIAKGGHPSDLSNLQLAHRACNREKGTHIIPQKKRSEQDLNQILPLSRDWRTQ